MITGNIYNIMIGSPSDVTNIAQIAVECINRWNALHTNDRKIALIPHHWTSSSYPSLRDSAQSVINQQMVDNSDALVAVFGSRIGTPTENHISGTVEEIKEHLKANKPVMVFFSSNWSTDTDFAQLQKLNEFKNSLNGLYDSFNNPDDFRNKFSEKLLLFVQKEFSAPPHEPYSNESKNPVNFTEVEVDLLKQWCKAKSNYLSILKFIGGHTMFSFSGKSIETTTAKETAEMDDFIKRMLLDELIELTGYDKHNNPKYKLTLKAFQQYSEE